MFGLGDVHLDGLCIGIDNVEIIAEGKLDLCYFFALDCMKNTAIIMVHHVDSPLWVILLGKFSTTTIVCNLSNYVTYTNLEVTYPSADVNKRVRQVHIYFQLVCTFFNVFTQVH